MQLQGADHSLINAAIEGDFENLDLSDKEVAWLEFVRLLTLNSYKNSPEVVQGLRDHGWTDPQIRETVLVVGMFSMFNRVADAFGLDDPDYFQKEAQGQGMKPATRPS